MNRKRFPIMESRQALEINTPDDGTVVQGRNRYKPVAGNQRVSRIYKYKEKGECSYEEVL